MEVSGACRETEGVAPETRPLGVYVHVPWCPSKCPYCDFNSRAADGGVPERRYVRAVLGELSLVPGSARPPGPLGSIYLGGGTPSLLTPAGVGSILDAVTREFPGPDTPEVTLEVNPETVDEERLRAYREAGVNRISIGVQSLDDRVLRAMGRIHTARRALESYVCARRAGFGNVGVDLIFACPGQREREWEETLERVIEHGPEHVSLYSLTIEEGTPFAELYGPDAYASVETPRYDLPGEYLQARMYEHAVERLTDEGYLHYEVSNFARPGFESRHNGNYWTGGDYLGLGPGAHSYMRGPGWGTRWWNETEPEVWMDAVSSGELPRKGLEELTREQALAETIMLGLRTSRGVDTSELESRFGPDASAGMEDRLARLSAQSLVEKRGSRVVLTEKGLILADEVLRRVLP